MQLESVLLNIAIHCLGIVTSPRDLTGIMVRIGGNRSLFCRLVSVSELMTIYPLVICYIAIENGHRHSGFSHEKWWIVP